jgi:hypothetical protein
MLQGSRIIFSGMSVFDLPREGSVRFAFFRHRKQRRFYLRLERQGRSTFFEVSEDFLNDLLNGLAFVGQPMPNGAEEEDEADGGD